MPFERIRKILGKERILLWNHELHPGLMWRFPDLSSQIEMERDPTKIEAFQVKIGERAIALINNAFYDDSPPGIYWLKGEEKKGLEVIWIDQGQLKEPWGIPGNILTQDNQYIGAHGFYIFRITDPKSFVLSLVSTQRAYTPEQVNDFIRGYVANVLRQHLTNYKVLDGQILREREAFNLAMKAKCQEMFARWGLELINMEVEVHVPDDVFAIIRERARTELEAALTRELELRKPLEEKRLEIDRYLETLKMDMEKAKMLKAIEIEKDLTTQLGHLDILRKQLENTLESMKIETAKHQADISKIVTEMEAGRTERLAQADAMKTELTERAKIAGELLSKITDSELRIKDAQLRLEELRVISEAQVKIAEAMAKMGVELTERQMRAIRELGDVMARTAEATAIGGAEGEAVRKGLWAEFYRLLAESGIDVHIPPPSHLVEIKKEVERKEERKVKTCPSCGRRLPSESKYCDMCGAKLV